ncbi:MAG: pyruvate carboxylase [Mailhella sp.]|nr:pyruvate carboxylase [Mailhella sp.]
MTQITMEELQEQLRDQPILVANRGIPGRRICRAIRERFKAVAIMTATDVDKVSPAASSAQELMLLGSDPTAYLDLDLIIQKAKKRHVLAIHPGWGFASEDDTFPRKCEEAGITFIGSTADSMNLLGNKVQARKLAIELGVPVVPGSEGAVSIEEARSVIKEIGLPVMLKAEGGGGGRGIFVIKNEDELEDAFLKASTMAEASFGNPRLYVEKYLEHVRHIEIQIAADKYGNVFAFDERDCSVQRNHQKLIEITPSPWKGMTEDLRARLKDYARRMIKAVNYHSLATVEFLVTQDGTPYLIEINTRLQVEHGVTECRYGIDLVETQIAIAFGAPLPFTEENTIPSEFAMQVRINCEDPQNDFTPNCGRITRYVSPGGPGVRLDSNLSAGYEFPSNYDSAGSLLIAYGRDWKKILGTMERALSEYKIEGVKTTIPFYRHILGNRKFRSAEFTTSFIEETPDIFTYQDMSPEGERLTRLVAEISAKGYNPYVSLGEYRSSTTPRMPRFNPVLPHIPQSVKFAPNIYPHGDRAALLDYVRDSGKIHFTDTTTRDATQSNSGNRLRLAEDELVGPYLDSCQFFSLESGGGAHFHVAMLANMTYPFSEAAAWNVFAPKTLKQILVRSTNVLGYSPQPKNLMRITGEMICEHFQIIRCFDFLNDIRNMKPLAEVVLDRKDVVFEPALSMSLAKGFTVDHYLDVTKETLRMVASILGCSEAKAASLIILGLKDMAGICPPRFMTELVSRLRKQWPNLVLHYHRHYTDGLFVPSVGAAAKAGVQIVDVNLGACQRTYGQGEVLSTAAYMEGELGLETVIDKDRIREANFVLKQISPYYDRYCSPYFQGVDHDVTKHGMPGGATSSSQEGAMKQGYIKLLPYMLRFLEGTRQIVRYHDVTPGSQITWNTAFLAVTGAWKRGDEQGVQHLLNILDEVVKTPEESLSDEVRKARLELYRDCNDAFRNLLLGKFGKLPLGFPPDWVYESAFGASWKNAVAERTLDSPLQHLQDADIEAERAACAKILKRQPNDEELVLYLNHPGDAIKTIQFVAKFGDPNKLPLDVWFEGLETGRDMHYVDSQGKPHIMHVYHIDQVDDKGYVTVRYSYDSQFMTCDVKVAEPVGHGAAEVPMADPADPMQIGSPSNGDLWVVHVKPGDIVKKGQEVFNISIMKQEKAVLAEESGMVKRVLKVADYKNTRKMLPVREGELIVELEPVPHLCPNPECRKPLSSAEMQYCPWCGTKIDYCLLNAANASERKLS